MSNLSLVNNTQSNNSPIQDDRIEERFNKLFNLYNQDLNRYAYWLSGDKQIAEDLVQETLLRAWRSLDKLQNEKAAKDVGK